MSSKFEYQLFPHQVKAIKGCLEYPFRLVYRLPGTGKTLICVELLKRQLQRNADSFILWLGPANLIPQYQKVLDSLDIGYGIFDPKTHNIPSGVCILTSYEMLRIHVEDFLKNKWDCVLCDEFHRAKSEKTQTNNVLKQLRQKSSHFFAFTGTPFQNSPYEFFELVSVVANKSLSFDCESTLQYKRPKWSLLRTLMGKMGFHVKRLNQGPIIGVSNPQRLRELISRYIDYIPPEEYTRECHLPVVNEYIERVSLDKEEITSYGRVLKSYRKNKDSQFLNDELEDDKIETSFNRLVELRQNLLSVEGKISSKILRCVKDLKNVLSDPENRVLVFSNFVKQGLKQLSYVLKNENIRFSLYEGSTSVKERKNMIKNYFSGDIPLMLLSPVGFEGLDLYGTTHIFVLDPHFNPERTRQLISRAIRAYSGVKKIDVCHYIAVAEELKQPCIDEVILKIAERKKNLAKIIENCLLPDNRSNE